MRNAVFVKRFAGYHKTFASVEASRVALSFQLNRPSVRKEVGDSIDAGLKNDFSQTLTAHGRDYSADLYGVGKSGCCKDAQIGEDFAVVLKPNMKSLSVDSVQVLIGAFLFNHEDATSSLKDSVELVGGEVGKAFFV